MYKKYLLKFYEKISNYNDYDYLEAVLRLNVAPTMSKLKIGTMVNVTNGSRNLKSVWDIYINKLLNRINLNYIELRESRNSILLLFYNDDLLNDRLKSNNIKEFLVEFGYEKDFTLFESLSFLKSRFEKLKCCPNEVGIFLGYPLDDVKDFNCHNNKCKVTGYWQCYNNEKYALKAFKSYDTEKLKVIEEVLKIKRAV